LGCTHSSAHQRPLTKNTHVHPQPSITPSTLDHRTSLRGTSHPAWLLAMS
jgi:hypothetical protein